jgi:NADH-quinone oxidoreductase subunit M
MASAGLPTLCGFPGEFMILSGTFTGGAPLDLPIFAGNTWTLRLHHVQAILAASGVILAAVYLLWMVQKVLFGPLQDPANEHMEDMNSREVAVLIPFAVMAVVMGLIPNTFVSRFEPSVRQFVTSVHQRGGSPYEPDSGVLRLHAGNERPLPSQVRDRIQILRPMIQAPGSGTINPVRIERPEGMGGTQQ